MSKVSIDSIENVPIPKDLSDDSNEVSIFQSKEIASHEDHKIRQENELLRETAKQRIRTLEIKNDGLVKLGSHRRRYSWWILGFSIFVFSCVLALVILASWQVKISETECGIIEFETFIQLDNEVLMTLLGTTVVQVVGLLFVVAKWLFPSIGGDALTYDSRIEK